MNHFIYITSFHSFHGKNMNSQLTSLPMCGFIAQLVEHRTGIAEVTGSNPVEALIFFFSGFFIPIAHIGNSLRRSHITFIFNFYNQKITWHLFFFNFICMKVTSKFNCFIKFESKKHMFHTPRCSLKKQIQVGCDSSQLTGWCLDLLCSRYHGL